MRSYFIWWNSASFPLLHVLSPKMVLWVFILHYVLVFYPPRSCNTFFLRWNVALSALSFPVSPHKICSFPCWPQVSLHVPPLPSLPTISCNSSKAFCLFVLLCVPGSLFAPGYLVCLHLNNVSWGPCLWSPLCFVFSHLDWKTHHVPNRTYLHWTQVAIFLHSLCHQDLRYLKAKPLWH